MIYATNGSQWYHTGRPKLPGQVIPALKKFRGIRHIPPPKGQFVLWSFYTMDMENLG